MHHIKLCTNCLDIDKNITPRNCSPKGQGALPLTCCSVVLFHQWYHWVWCGLTSGIYTSLMRFCSTYLDRVMLFGWYIKWCDWQLLLWMQQVHFGTLLELLGFVVLATVIPPPTYTVSSNRSTSKVRAGVQQVGCKNILLLHPVYYCRAW